MEEGEGEVIHPLQVGEERVPGTVDVKKKLVKPGVGWETPQLDDEATFDYIGTTLSGGIFDSTKNHRKPLTLAIDEGENMVPNGLGNCIMTMKRGEIALFTFPADPNRGHDEDSPPSSVIQVEIKLISWTPVIVIGEGIFKRYIEKGNNNEKPGVLDDVLVRYQAENDGSVVAKTPDEGIEFCVKDGHLCPALPLTVVTMLPGEKAKLVVLPQYGFREEGRSASGKFPEIPPTSVLEIEVELVSFKSKIRKKVIRDGEGPSVGDDGATVTVTYVAKLEDGTIFEKKGVEKEEPLVFVTDEEQVISGLDKAVTTMKRGEKAVLTISPEYGFGNVEVQRDLAKVPQCAVLTYEVEMLDFVKEKRPWEMTNQETIVAANRKKEEGNLLHKNQKYQRAAKKYNQAAECIANGYFYDDEKKQVEALKVSCLLNGAACCLKLKDFLKATWLCSKALMIDFQNVKALYRRAQSLIETGDLVSAETDIKKALEADPENREVKSLYRTLQQSKAESYARLYANIYASAENAV
ncbi:hypothetical protein EUTSA_v10024088mg [Eutrema salsugineum]|uniref:peptidylprolyl isomerase n=1 Tax=Eutrema salsugineum TaxID=72664 RepID=V4KI76_EUTSA|nr:hypothetical protein EUTSA_v10024088mg [Eutrema salsugineum]